MIDITNNLPSKIISATSRQNFGKNQDSYFSLVGKSSENYVYSLSYRIHVVSSVENYIMSEYNNMANYTDKKKFLNAVELAIKYHLSILNNNQNKFNIDTRLLKNYDINTYEFLTQINESSQDINEYLKQYVLQENLKVLCLTRSTKTQNEEFCYFETNYVNEFDDIIKYINNLRLKNKIEQLADRCTHQNESLVVYQSKLGNAKINLNGQVDFFGFDDQEMIQCRQGCFDWLRRGKNAHLIYDLPEKIKVAIPHNYYDKKLVALKGDEYLMFSLDNFGEQLYQLSKNMQFNTIKYITITSENHLMALKLHFFGGQIVPEFYDFNYSNISKKCRTYSDLLSLRMINIQDFLNKEDVEQYFPKIKFGMLTVYNNPNEDFNKKKVFDFTSMSFNELCGQTVLEPSIQLFFMCKYGCNDAEIYPVMSSIFNSNISHQRKIDKLVAKNAQNTPALSLAFQDNYSKIVGKVIDYILSSTALTLEDKFHLIDTKNGDGFPGFFMAISSNSIETVKVFIKKILNNRIINTQQKVKLLSAQYKKVPALIIACMNGYSEIVELFMSSVITDKVLSSTQKVELLFARYEDYNSLLHTAVKYKRLEIASLYADIILNNKAVFDNRQILQMLHLDKLDYEPMSQLLSMNSNLQTVYTITESRELIVNPEFKNNDSCNIF